MRPIVKCILNQLCVTSNFTQDIICAAPSKGGLGCINLHDMQEKKHAKLAMDVFHTKSVTGDLLECSLQEILLDIVSDCSIGKWELNVSANALLRSGGWLNGGMHGK